MMLKQLMALVLAVFFAMTFSAPAMAGKKQCERSGGTWTPKVPGYCQGQPGVRKKKCQSTNGTWVPRVKGFCTGGSGRGGTRGGGGGTGGGGTGMKMYINGCRTEFSEICSSTNKCGVLLCKSDAVTLTCSLFAGDITEGFPVSGAFGAAVHSAEESFKNSEEYKNGSVSFYGWAGWQQQPQCPAPYK